MAVKCYIYPEVQDFQKENTGNTLFGLQNAATYKLPVIYDAFAKGSTASPTSITAVKIKVDKTEISRTALATNLIIYDAVTDQYIIDSDLILTTLFDECTYFIEFENGLNLYKTDAFLVQKMNYEILASNRIILASSSILNNQSTINI